MEHLEGVQRIFAEVRKWPECKDIFDGTPMRCLCKPANLAILVRMRQLEFPIGYGATVTQCRTCKHPNVIIEILKAQEEAWPAEEASPTPSETPSPNG